MTPELLKHIENHLPTFNVWIDTNAELQPSNDLIVPIIKAYQKENPTFDLSGACRECLTDMVRWARKELKASKNEQTGLQKEKEHKDKKPDAKKQ